MAKIKQKIHEVISNKEEIRQLIQLLSNIDDSNHLHLALLLEDSTMHFIIKQKEFLVVSQQKLNLLNF